MLELKFSRFQEQLAKARVNTRPTLHCVEDNELFKLLYKNFEKWEYFTIMLKSEIVSFGEAHGVSGNISIEDFRNEYTAGAVKLESSKNISIGKKIVKSEIEAGKDVIDESKDYDKFLVDNISLWEKKVLAIVHRLDDEVQKDYTEKTFGEFLEGMTNAINSIPFVRGLRRIIKKDYQAGVNSAETEIEVQIGFSDTMFDKVKMLEQQQLNGYTIDGKFWPGIKGMARKTQFKVLQQVQEDLANKKGIKEISENIKDIFSVSKTQSERIARTETTRFINNGKLDGYKDANIPKKAYAAVMDDRTADICRRLHHKYFDGGIPVNDDFIDDVTGKAKQGPPFHVNCRCVIEARL